MHACIKYMLHFSLRNAVYRAVLTYDLTSTVCGRGTNARCTALLRCCSTERTLEYIVKSGFLSLIHYRVLSVLRLQQSFHWATRPHDEEVSRMLVDKDLEESALITITRKQ